MGKTTIDGLAVRSSSDSNKRANFATPKKSKSTKKPLPNNRNTHKPSPARTKAKPNAKMTPRRTTSSVTEPLILNSTTVMQDIQPAHHNRANRVSDFVQPEDSYDELLGVDELETASVDFTADENDWSDLLDGFGEAKSVRPESNDFLKDNTDSFFGDSDEEPEPAPRRKAPRKKKSKKRKVIKAIIFSLLALLLVGGVVAFIWGDQIISKLTNGNSGIWDTVWSLVSDEVPFAEDENGRTNVLIFGTEGYDMNGSTGNGGVHAGAQLTDSIMAVSFDQETKDVAMISIPRDLKVSRACSVGKINEVYSCHNNSGANEAAGAEALAEQLSDVLGIDFQYWVHVNWGSLEDIVDLLGGITVTLDEDVNDYNYTTMVVKAGVPTQLTGVQAVALARARHGTAGGDFTRGGTQQKILEGIVEKVVSSGIGVTDAINLLNILGDNFRSNFSSENIKSGVSLAAGFDINNMRQVLLVDYNTNTYYVKTDMINGVSYVIPSAGLGNYHNIHEYVDKMLSSNPAVREGALLSVFNASWTEGAAQAEQAGLEAEGFSVIGVGEVSEHDCTDTYCVYSLNDEMPATAEILRSKYQVDLRPASELSNDIRPGASDFVIVIGNTGE